MGITPHPPLRPDSFRLFTGSLATLTGRFASTCDEVITVHVMMYSQSM